MPARRRHRNTPTSPVTAANAAPSKDDRLSADLARFNASLEATKQAKHAAARAAEQAADHQRQLAAAEQRLTEAINAVRRAKESGRGRAEADEAWRVAKAEVIRLQTGQAPTWAPETAAEPASSGEDASEEAGGEVFGD